MAHAANQWYHCSSHGTVLIQVAANPDCTISEIADALSLTRRSVWGTIGDLRQRGMLEVRKNGRRHHYTVNLDAPFLHPSVTGYTLGDVIGGLVKQVHGRTTAVAS
jgi:biotin operon repressor